MEASQSPQSTGKPLPLPNSLGRGLPTNPAQSVRRKQPQATATAPAAQQQSQQVVRPSPTKRGTDGKALSPPSAAPVPVSGSRVLVLARAALKHALVIEEARAEDAASASESGSVISEVRRSLNIDMSRENIKSLPDEIVDIFTQELERLALSHNFLTSLPPRFAEFTSLRYLNVKNNALDEFPLLLCELKALEFLDLSGNKLRALPPEIANLTSLRVFSIEKNKIEELPVCLGDMLALQRLKYEDNPLKFPPPEVLQQFQPPEGLGIEDAERVVTGNIRKFLRRTFRRPSFKSDNRIESVPESFSETRPTEVFDEVPSKDAETSRVRTRRATGRFPAKGAGIDMNVQFQQQPLPQRSEHRTGSLSDAANQRSGGSLMAMDESVTRSISAPEVQKNPFRGGEQVENKADRPGIMPFVRKDELGALVPTPNTSRRISQHSRGFSSGSVLDKNHQRQKSQVSNEDLLSQRPQYVRQLTAIPIRRMEPAEKDPVLEVAQGVLWSIYHIHLSVQTMMGLTNDGTIRRSSLEMVFYNTNVYFQELEMAIQTYMESAESLVYRENESMQRAYSTLLMAYIQVCSRLMSSVDILIDYGDLRYVRTFAMAIWQGIMELRVAMTTAAATPTTTRPGPKDLAGDTLKNQPPPTTTVKTKPPILNFRARSNSPRKRRLKVNTDVPTIAQQKRDSANKQDALSAEAESANTIVHLTPPQSAGSFTSAITSSGESSDNEDKLDPEALSATADIKIKRFLTAIRTATTTNRQHLPALQTEFAAGARQALTQRQPRETVLAWDYLVNLCETLAGQSEIVRRDIEVLQQQSQQQAFQKLPTAFSDQCNTFFASWASLGGHIRASVSVGVKLSPVAKNRLKALAREMRDSIVLMAGVPGAQGKGGQVKGSGSAPGGGSGITREGMGRQLTSSATAPGWYEVAGV